MADPRGTITEVYSIIQGEGIYVGERQILVRFFHCSLGCRYCDTPNHLFKPGKARIEQTAGKRDFVFTDGEVAPETLAIYCERLNRAGLHHSITLTGGEPLEQADFLKFFIPRVKAQTHLPIFLETSGILWKELQKLRGLINIVSMDFKLPSATGLRTFWKEHELFLREAAANSEVYVKMVVNSLTGFDEIETGGQLIERIDGRIPLILQPETGQGIEPEKILEFQELLKNRLKKVLVIPQTHKIMNQL